MNNDTAPGELDKADFAARVAIARTEMRPPFYCWWFEHLFWCGVAAGERCNCSGLVFFTTEKEVGCVTADLEIDKASFN